MSKKSIIRNILSCHISNNLDGNPAAHESAVLCLKGFEQVIQTRLSDCRTFSSVSPGDLQKHASVCRDFSHLRYC